VARDRWKVPFWQAARRVITSKGELSSFQEFQDENCFFGKKAAQKKRKRSIPKLKKYDFYNLLKMKDTK